IELEREKMALQLEEEKKAQAEKERVIKEHEQTIENLSTMVLNCPSNVNTFEGKIHKLTHSYFALLEVLCNCHTNVIVNLDTSTFAHIVGSLESGLKSLDVNISTQ
ncbi:hypothetical protein KI387_027923, partial [Taxus chinensis]